MARGKVGVYDDGRLVEMLAGGEWTYGEIGQALGLTAGHVGRIARGERRPRVMAEVRARVAAALAEARRVGVRWCRALMERHVEVGLGGKGETARKCREFVLSRLDLTRPSPHMASATKTHGPQSVGVELPRPAPQVASATKTRGPQSVGVGAAAEGEMEAWVAEMVKSQGPRPRAEARRQRRGHHPNFVRLGVR